MGTKSRRSKSPTTSTGSLGRASGRKTNGSLARMNTNVELQRRNISHETSSSAGATANLMARESFSLDDPVPQTPTVNNHGFFDLPKRDQKNFGLLVLLY